MASPQEKPLTKQQIKAASALARGFTREMAASHAECGERSLYRWLERADFRLAIEQMRQGYLSALEGALTYCGRGVVSFLLRVVGGKESGQDLKIRVTAAGVLLKAATSMTRAEDRNFQRAGMISFDAAKTSFVEFLRTTQDILEDDGLVEKLHNALMEKDALTNPVPGSPALKWGDLFE